MRNRGVENMYKRIFEWDNGIVHPEFQPLGGVMESTLVMSVHSAVEDGQYLEPGNTILSLQDMCAFGCPVATFDALDPTGKSLFSLNTPWERTSHAHVFGVSLTEIRIGFSVHRAPFFGKTHILAPVESHQKGTELLGVVLWAPEADVELSDSCIGTPVIMWRSYMRSARTSLTAGWQVETDMPYRRLVYDLRTHLLSLQ